MIHGPIYNSGNDGERWLCREQIAARGCSVWRCYRHVSRDKLVSIAWLSPPQTLWLGLLTYIQDNGSHLFIALTPNKHHDYPRRTPFLPPPPVWSSSGLVIITLTSWVLIGFKHVSGNWQAAKPPGVDFMANHYPKAKNCRHVLKHILKKGF